MKYDAFLREVLPYAVGCSEPVAINAIRNATIEFCAKSHWLRYEVDPQTIIPGLARYDIDIPSINSVAQVVEVWADGRRLEAKAEEELATLFPDDWRDASGAARFFTQLTLDELILCPTPDTRIVNALKIIVALQPARAATECDDSIYEWWLETIAFGARARLYQTPGQPYSDPTAVAFCMGEFNKGVQEAKRRRQAGLVRGPLRVQLRSF